MRSFAKAALSALGLASAASAYMTHTVVVGGTTDSGSPLLKFTPEYLNADEGDTVLFQFHVKNHTVTQSSFASPCAKLADTYGNPIGLDSGFEPVPPTSTNFPTFQFTVNSSTDPLWFYCRQRADPNPTHCQQGMVFSVNPGSDTKFMQFLSTAEASTTQNLNTTSNSTSTSTTWAAAAASTASAAASTHTVIVGGTLPDGTPDLTFKPNNFNASIGDTVLFKFNVKNHTVTESTFASPCAEIPTPFGEPPAFDSGFEFVAPNSTDWPEFSINITTTAPIWGYCRQRNDPKPTHCQSGMVFGINPAGKFDAFLASAKVSTTQNLANTTTTSNTTMTHDAMAGSSSNATTTASAAAVTHTVLVGGTKPDGTPDLSFKPDNFNASVGDWLEFHFNVKNHTVTQSPFGAPCSKLTDLTGNNIGFDSGFMPVMANMTGPMPVFSVQVNNTAPIWGYCRQLNSPNRSHCQSDMVFGVNTPLQGNTFGKYQVLAEVSTDQGIFTGSVGNLTFVNTSAPTAAEPAKPQKTHDIIVGGFKADGLTADLTFAPNNINASVGDLVRFFYLAKNHSVTQSSFANPCTSLSSSSAGMTGFDSGFMPSDASLTTALLTTMTNTTSFGNAPNASLLASVANLPNFSFTVNDTNPIWGYCKQVSPPVAPATVGVGHCQQGMVFAVNAGDPSKFTTFLNTALALSNSSANSTKSAAIADAEGNTVSKKGVPTAVWALIGVAVGLGLILAAFAFFNYRRRAASRAAYGAGGAPVMSKKAGFSLFGQRYSKVSGNDGGTVFDHDEFDHRDGPELKPYGDGGAGSGNTYRDMPEAPPMPRFRDDNGDETASTTPRGTPRGTYEEPKYTGA